MEVNVDPYIDPQLAGPALKATGSQIKSNLRLPPPPLFSRQVVPHLYKLSYYDIYALLSCADRLSSYKANPASIEVSIVNEATGEVKQRLLNRMRWKGIGSTAIDFSDKNVGCLLFVGTWLADVVLQVPERASDIVEQHRSQAEPKLLKRLEEVRHAFVVLRTIVLTRIYPCPALRRTSYLVTKCPVQPARASRSPRNHQACPYPCLLRFALTLS